MPPAAESGTTEVPADIRRPNRASGFLGRIRARRQALRDAVRTRLWPVPAAAVVTGIIAGILLPELDARLDPELPAAFTDYLFGGGADAARTILGTIATALITVTSLTFSLTLVTLQLASSQYSPRLLRTFSGDPFVQRTLALLLGTFTYALTVLRTIRNADGDVNEFVPQFSVTTAYALGVACVLALVLFLGHLVRQIRIETMLDQVATEAIATGRRLLRPLDSDDHPAPPPPPPPNPHITAAAGSGFLVEIDEQRLLDIAVDCDTVLWVQHTVGDTVVAGTPAVLRPDSGDDIDHRIASALHHGPERTTTQDLGYGIRQLTDVVVRALSPGINDPTTAVHGLNSAATVLRAFADRHCGPLTLVDHHGTARVHLPRPDLPELLDTACAQPRHYGAHDPLVLHGLLSLLGALGHTCRREGDRAAVREQLSRVGRTIADQEFDDGTRRGLEEHLAVVTDTAIR
ncbi:DUF2254 domain-containing protein [Nocardia sputi]|uniref:DUF2254 domain-containing protein n=1 Tax=Nocardia sputi TaxID=2943705 RepID=UPI0020C12B94|nr:DUF2254 domain-containing protein [Nocardia sputi]